MTPQDGGARRDPIAPATKSTVIDESLVRAAVRVLAGHYCPDWRPADDGQLDAWGHGFNTAWNQAYAAGRSGTRHWPLLPECDRCARDADEKCVDRGVEVGNGAITCGCGCWTWAADHAR